MNSVFKALNEETRREILELLRKSDLTTTSEILENFTISRSSILHPLDLRKQTNSKPIFIFIIISLLFSIVGNYFKTIRLNYRIGIQISWILVSKEFWKKKPLLRNNLWFTGGVLIAISTLFLPDNFSFYTFTTTTPFICLIPIIYFFKLFEKINCTPQIAINKSNMLSSII
ncbi:SdpI family protein [Flavobacterium sp. J27]|uniref:SdpI family protein n=1 Tax=Flavobacterium sp. J27 TaxID=2060419 RepID=UPI00103145F3|nr:SdpI family protein [Flavobacterium sp. J27]